MPSPRLPRPSATSTGLKYGKSGNCSDLWGSTGHQASHRGAAKHGICFVSRLVPSNVNSYEIRGTIDGDHANWYQVKVGLGFRVDSGEDISQG